MKKRKAIADWPPNGKGQSEREAFGTVGEGEGIESIGRFDR